MTEVIEDIYYDMNGHTNVTIVLCTATILVNIRLSWMVLILHNTLELPTQWILTS